MTAYLRVLRDNPDFTRLWLAQVISLLGDWFNTIALSALVVAYNPENSGLAISGLLLARFVPPMLMSPAAGVLVDRFDRKWLLIWSNLLRAVVVLLFLLATQGAAWLWLIYVLTILQFILSSVFEPGQSAIIPNLVKRDDLVEANTLVSVTWSVMLALGAVVGGVVASLFGTNAALIIDAITFAVAGGLLLGIKNYQRRATVGSTLETETAANAEDEQKSFIDGLRYLRRNPTIASALLVKSGTSLGSVDTLLAVFATQIFVLGEGGQLSLGILYSAFGLGALLGPILTNRVNDGSISRMQQLIVVGFVSVVVGWLLIGAAPTLAVLCIAMVLRAMGGAVNWTYSTVIIQKSSSDAFLGRMFSLDMALFYLSVVVGTIAHGTLIDLLGNENIALIAFGTMAVSLMPLAAWSMLTRRSAQTLRIVEQERDVIV